MKYISDTLPPAPASALTQDQHVMNIGASRCLVNARHGGFLAHHYDFFVGNALIRYGEYAEARLNLLKQFVQPGCVIVDVGANIGAHTVPLAKAAGASGKMIAIEPQRIIHQHLCTNISLNNLPNVETYHAGCGERRSVMSVPMVNYFAEKKNNFSAVALRPEGQGEPITITPLDDIIGTQHAHLIIVDVEGMEAEVLRGSKKTLKRCRPTVYVRNEKPEKSEELIRLLQHYQYRLYWHTPALYSPLNFFEEHDNIYGPAVSIYMVCIPSEAVINMHHFVEVTDPRQHPVGRT